MNYFQIQTHKPFTTLIFVGEHLQEEFTNVSALKILPVIDDNGFILSER